MTTEVNLDPEIDQIKTMLKRNTEEKLDLIRFFLISSSNLEVIRIANEEDLIGFLTSTDTPYEFIEIVYNLLDLTFSRGYPNFVSEFSLFEDVTNSDLEEALEVTFPEDESIMPI